MSMLILNSKFSERHPTIMDGLIYTYPFDGEKHCCIADIRYARVLRIDNGSNDLYNYFQSKGSIITNSSLSIENDQINFIEGQYNLILIDSKTNTISKQVLDKIKEESNKAKTSVIIYSLNTPETIFNYGGSYISIDSRIDEKTISDAITRSSLFKNVYSENVLKDCIKLSKGSLGLLWDNRLEEFSISLDIEIEEQENNAGIVCIANSADSLLSILYDKINRFFVVKSGTKIINPTTNKEVLLNGLNKITITKYGDNLNVFCNDELVTKAILNSSTKGNTLIIGKNTLTNMNNSATIRVSNLSVFSKKLSTKDVVVLNKGRLIFT